MATAPVPLGGAEETAGAGHGTHHPASQQLVRGPGGWAGAWGARGGRPGAVRCAEGARGARGDLRLLLPFQPSLPSSLCLCAHLCRPPTPSSMSMTPPPFSRFINARRRIVQPMIDQSNRTGTRRRWGERAQCSPRRVKAQTQAPWGSGCTPKPLPQGRVQPSAQRASPWGPTLTHSHT